MFLQVMLVLQLCVLITINDPTILVKYSITRLAVYFSSQKPLHTLNNNKKKKNNNPKSILYYIVLIKLPFLSTIKKKFRSTRALQCRKIISEFKKNYKTYALWKPRKPKIPLRNIVII